MLYLMTNHINIIIIILLTIKIISIKAKQQPMANNCFNDNDELYGNFTAIEFLKELEHAKPTYDSILIMQNQNATISNIFYTHLIKVLNKKHVNGTASTNGQQGFGILSEMVTTTFVKRVMDCLQVPVLQLNELQSFYLKRHYSEHFLSIVYIDINIEGIQMTFNEHKGLLEKLSRNLLHMTTSKVMFLLNFPLAVKADTNAAAAAATIYEDIIQGVLVQLFQHCWQQRIINVVALLADYQTTRVFYSYNQFPKFQLEVKNLAQNPEQHQDIFPNRLRNLKGYKLNVVVNGTEPSIIPYRTRRGRRMIGGFVGHFFRLFCKKINCTMIASLQEAENLRVITAIVKNGTADMSSAVLSPNNNNLIGYTYPIEAVDICALLPVEANIPGYKIFTSVFKGNTYLLVISAVIALSIVLTAALYLHSRRTHIFDYFCHSECLRGILGQAFSEITNPPIIIKCIYLKISLLGILLATSYTSFISTYVTRPPKVPALNSFDDILCSGLKFVLWEREYKITIDVPEYKKYESMFHVVETFWEFLRIRDSFNTNYGYLMPWSKWMIIKEQQKMFATPLFRYLPHLCAFNNIPFCIPVHENSIYTSLINQLILDTAQSGLPLHWNRYAFLELIAAKRIKLIDLSTREEFRQMTLNDLKYVLFFLAVMFIIVNFVLLCELMIFHRKKILNKFKKCSSKIKRNLSKIKFKHERKHLLTRKITKEYTKIDKQIQCTIVFKDVVLTKTTRVFYSYTQFPKFQLEIKKIGYYAQQQQGIFPNRLRNINGYKLRVLINGTEPAIITYKNKKGERIIGGFVGHFLRFLCKKLNCTLVEILQESTNIDDIGKMVRSGIADISSAILPAEKTFRDCTYPIEMRDSCALLPVEATIPGYKFFTAVFKGNTYLLVISAVIALSTVLTAALYLHGRRTHIFDYFCHCECLRGILGQAFSEISNPSILIRCIYLKICLLGILLATSYTSFFSTYVTRPPKEPFLNSIDDILQSGLKIVAWKHEYNKVIEVPEYKKCKSIFHIVDNLWEFVRMRDSLNTEFGYTTPTSKWLIIQEQQKIFTTPLFRYSKNICFIKNIPFCLPIHENSLYGSIMNQLILEASESGLLIRWMKHAFLELIEAKKLKLEDRSKAEEFRQMTVDDLRYVLIFLGFMLVTVILVFLFELFVYHRRNILKTLKKGRFRNI